MGETGLGAIRREMRREADAKDALFLQGYFKTGPGGYAQGDRFLGLRVPAVRRIARAHRALARPIAGSHVDPARPVLLERLARSRSLWERRIAMLSTFHWIAQGEFRPALRIARMLRDDPHDLIHRAVGWGLREIGRRDRACEEGYLQAHAAVMPRTMLRYALERLPPARRAFFMRQGR